jgi:hypothetical protein
MPVREAIENLGHVLAAQPERALVKGAPATARLVDGLRTVVEGPSGECVRTDMGRTFGLCPIAAVADVGRCRQRGERVVP